MTTLTAQLSKALEFDRKKFEELFAANNGGRKPDALESEAGWIIYSRLAPLHQALLKVVCAAEQVRSSRYPERSHVPELEQALAELREVVG